MPKVRAKPKLSAEERARRGKRAKAELVPAAEEWVGKVGFTKAKEALAKHPEVESPEKLAGFLKGKAKARGILSEKHPYAGRKKKHREGKLK